MKLTKNDIFPDRTVLTASSGEKKLSELLGNGMNALVFLRYFGCPLCQYEMYDFAEQYEKIKAAGSELLVVLQSTPESIARQKGEAEFPYEIICDPDCGWYKELDINVAASFDEMDGPGTKELLKKVDEKFMHGDSEGEEMQFPAVFVIDKEMKVIDAKYASFITDIYTGEELAKLLI